MTSPETIEIDSYRAGDHLAIRAVPQGVGWEAHYFYQMPRHYSDTLDDVTYQKFFDQS